MIIEIKNCPNKQSRSIAIYANSTNENALACNIYNPNEIDQVEAIDQLLDDNFFDISDVTEIIEN